MPREDRRIIFDYSEAYKAIYALCVQKELKKPPPGVIQSAESDKENDEKVIISLTNAQDNSAAQLEYSKDFLAAALLLYCRSQSIPVAKKGQKSVEFSGKNIILRVII